MNPPPFNVTLPVIVDDMDPTLSYDSNWMETTTFIQRLGAKALTSDNLFNGSLHGILGSSSGLSLGANFSYDFTGSGIIISGGISNGSELQNFQCSVDGLAHRYLQPSSNAQAVFCHAHNLPNGTQTISLTTNITDLDSGLWIDSIRFHPSNDTSTSQREGYQSSNLKLLRWASANITDGNFSQKNKLNFTFTGDSLTCLGCLYDSSFGTPSPVKIEIDEKLILSEPPNFNIFCNVSLSPGVHQVQINYSGNSKNNNCKPSIVAGNPGASLSMPTPSVINSGSQSTESSSPILSTSSGQGHLVGAIVGGVIGGLVLVLLITFILFIIWRRRSLKNNTHVEGSAVIQPDNRLKSIGNIASRRSARSSMHKSLPPAVPKQRSSIAKSLFSWRAYDDMGPQQTAQVGSDYGVSPTTPRRESRFSFESRRGTDRAEKDSL